MPDDPSSQDDQVAQLDAPSAPPTVRRVPLALECPTCSGTGTADYSLACPLCVGSGTLTVTLLLDDAAVAELRTALGQAPGQGA